MKEIYYAPFYNLNRDIIIEKCIYNLKKGKEVIYILPSREIMFEIRKDFIEKYGAISDIKVTSFSDLENALCSDYIKNFTFIQKAEILEILKGIIYNSNDIGVYEDVKNKKGFIKSIYSIIKRLKRLLIDPETFIKISSDFSKTLKEKCNIVGYIFQKYEIYKSKKLLIDIDDISQIAINMASKANFLDNVGIIVLDGFINIDVVNKKLMENIINEYPQIDFIANVPFKNEFNDTFVKSEILKDLLDLGFITKQGIFESHLIDENIKLLTSNLFSNNVVFNKRVDSIQVLNSPCIDYEIRQIAKIIKEKIKYNGIKPKDIVIYIKNLEDYKEKLKDIFHEMNITIRINNERKLLTMPIINDIYCAMKYILNKDYADFLNIISSKFLTPIEILQKCNFNLDNILTTGMKAIKSENPNKAEEFLNILEDDPALSQISDKMKEFIDIFSEYCKRDFKTAEEYIKSILDLIDDLDIVVNVKDLYKNKLMDGKTYIYNIKALEEFKSVLNTELFIKRNYTYDNMKSIKEDILSDIYDLLSEIELKIKSMDNEGVRILDPDLAKGQLYDIVFFIGLNEGIFPKIVKSSPLFDFTEENILMKNGINIYNHLWELERDKIRFNLCLASAKHEIYLSYRTIDEDGQYMIKSSFLNSVLMLFEKNVRIYIEKPIVYMRDRFKKYVDKGGTKYEISNDPKVKVSYDFNNEGFSVTQMNTYALCPYKYFIEKILNLDFSDEDMVTLENMGTLYHKILYEYYKENKNLYDLDATRLKNAINESIHIINEDHHIPKIVLDVRKEEIFSELSLLINDDIKNRLHYYKETGFELIPKIFEKHFLMSNHYGGNILKGKIDRVDLELGNNLNYTGKYLIYDYKSSSINSIKECCEGTDFQLATYKMAIENYLIEEYGIKDPKCIGLLYYSIKKLNRNGIIMKDSKKNLFIGRGGPKYLLTKNNFDILLKWVEENGLNEIDMIKKGIFNLPLICPYVNSGWKCKYRTICRYEDKNIH